MLLTLTCGCSWLPRDDCDDDDDDDVDNQVSADIQVSADVADS